LQQKEIASLSIVTEQRPDSDSSVLHTPANVELIRAFPFWYEKRGPFVVRLLGYALQNLQYFRLQERLPDDLDVLIVHAGLVRYVSALPIVLQGMRKSNPGIRLVADVRDPVFNEQTFSRLGIFDALICCSDNIIASLEDDPRLASRLHKIPVLFECSKPDKQLVRTVLLKHGLHEGQYILFTNGLVEKKGYRTALQMAEQLWIEGSRRPLVIVGRAQVDGHALRGVQKQEYVRYLGIVPHAEVLALAKGAALHLTVNDVEGMPRGCLEAIAVGTPVLVPNNIPEFASNCPRNLIRSTAPKPLAAQADEVISSRRLCQYDLAQHQPQMVARLYVELCNRLG